MRKRTLILIISISLTTISTAPSTLQTHDGSEFVSNYTSTECLGQFPLSITPIPEEEIYLDEGGFIKLTKDANMAEQMISDFLMVTRSFVHDTIFEFGEYLGFRSVIARQITSVCFLVGPSTAWKAEFEGQLYFMRRLHRAFEESAIIMDYFEMKNSQEQKLIHKVTQLYVKLMTLLNSHGNPDRQIENLRDIVMRGARLLGSWGATFVSLRNVPLSTSMVFQAQFAKATETVMFLLDSPGIERILEPKFVAALDTLMGLDNLEGFETRKE